jgi:hypothetical protein
MKTSLVLISLALFFGIATRASSVGGHSHATEPTNLTPDNTIILANETDARFSRDYSTLLKNLRIEWTVLDSADVPDSVKDKNLVLLGHPDAIHSGDVIRALLTTDEAEKLRAAGDDHVVLTKESPWKADRTVYVCTGADALLRRDAAEDTIRAIIDAAPPAADWIRTTYEAKLDKSVHGCVSQLQYTWDDAELRLEDLAIDVGAKHRGEISSQQAAQDVERLFSLLSHGYSGYAFFEQNGEFDQAKKSILGELPSQSSWSAEALADLLHHHLSFIVDRHMKIGDHAFAEHSDFWYDTQMELTPSSDGFQFVVDNTTFTLRSINEADPAPFLFPSLNRQGEPIYRLGMLSTTEPALLNLVAASDAGERPYEIKLQRSDFDHHSDDVFREDLLGGIPVVRVRSFSDYYANDLGRFIETASSHRGDPVIIVDIRGNGGGNEYWPSSWIQRLTGKRPESVFVSSELESRTSIIGRANAFAYWDSRASGPPRFEADANRHMQIAAALESGERLPRWSAPHYPQLPLIANDTTVIVVTNDLVASAGEGLVMRMSQAENVVVVGENTMGALTFGNLSAHQLPHSGLMVWLPINFGIFLDQEFREGVGLEPDLWVPAADAVNYAVAAVRRGTITTSQPLPPAFLEQEFKPENPYARDKQKQVRFLLVAAGFAVGGLVWAYLMRKKPYIVAGVGGLWILVGSIMSAMEKQPVGLGYLLIGATCLVWGGIRILKKWKRNAYGERFL